jgi:hypothetical protein
VGATQSAAVTVAQGADAAVTTSARRHTRHSAQQASTLRECKNSLHGTPSTKIIEHMHKP